MAVHSNERNHTAPGGRHAIRSQKPYTAPDSLIHELEELLAGDGYDLVSIGNQFKGDGFTNKDLVIAPDVRLGDVSLGWFIEVLKWDPSAAAGEPGAWTWAFPSPSIADRLAVYLYVLQIERERVDGVFMPDAHAAAQRKLSELLLEHPVLMHPRVRVHTQPSTWSPSPNGTCSIAHAIALSPNAHFPMDTDWPAGQAPGQRLREFADSVVVRIGLTSKSLCHQGELPHVKRRSPLAAAVKANPPRPGLLASLHALGRHGTAKNSKQGGAVNAEGVFLSNWKQLHNPEDRIRQAATEAESLLAACGVLTSSRSTVGAAALYRGPGMFAYLRSRGDEALKEVRCELRARVFEAIFGRSAASYNEDEVTYNLHAVASGLVEAGVHVDMNAATQWVRQQLQDVGTPAVEAHTAMGFIRAMRAHGVEIQPSDFSVFERDGNLSAAPGWEAALRADAAERCMNEVIRREAAPVESVGRRRLRVGV